MSFHIQHDAAECTALFPIQSSSWDQEPNASEQRCRTAITVNVREVRGCVRAAGEQLALLRSGLAHPRSMGQVDQLLEHSRTLVEETEQLFLDWSAQQASDSSVFDRRREALRRALDDEVARLQAVAALMASPADGPEEGSRSPRSLGSQDAWWRAFYSTHEETVAKPAACRRSGSFEMKAAEPQVASRWARAFCSALRRPLSGKNRGVLDGVGPLALVIAVLCLIILPLVFGGHTSLDAGMSLPEAAYDDGVPAAAVLPRLRGPATGISGIGNHAAFGRSLMAIRHEVSLGSATAAREVAAHDASRDVSVF